MKQIYQWVIMIGLLVTLLACSLLGLTNTPTAISQSGPLITISNPTAGSQLEVGQEIKVQSTSVDPDGVARVELFINDELERVDANANPQMTNAPFIVAQPWVPRERGFYVVQIKSYDTADNVSQSAPLTLEVVETTAIIEDTPTPTATSPAASPTPSPTGVDTPTPVGQFEPTETPTVTPTPIILNLPSPTPTPTVGNFPDTGLEPQGRFKDIWEIVPGGKTRLGYPTEPQINGRNFAKQRFERGEMFWWDNADGPDYIWVIDTYAADVNSGTTWNRYEESWPADEVDFYNCHEALANGKIGPVRGFGKLWCERFELQVRLGNPVEYEIGSAGTPPFSEVQFFQGGVMLYDPLNNDLLVLFNQGDWQRFSF